MKTNAIVRIVIYLLVILLLVGLLVAGLGFGQFAFHFGIPSGSYITGSGSANASEIRNLKIEWAAGSIKILPSDTDQITFSEEGNAGEDGRMVYDIDGSTLTIRCTKPGFRIGFFSNPVKNLTVCVPSDWQCSRLEVNAASADLDVENLTTDEMKINTASGECDFQSCTVGDLNISTASGSIRYTGTLDTLDCDAASASVTAVFDNVPKSIDMDSASGALDITLPSDCSFRVTMDTMSGRFHSDFPTESTGKAYTCGTGGCRIDVDSMSGDVTIRKGE